LLVASACEKTKYNPVAPGDYPIQNPHYYYDAFQAFWNGMNTRYIFWDYDPTNWDSVYTIYEPMFKQLDALKNVNQSAISYSYFIAMTSDLIDGHYLISDIKDNNADTNYDGIRPSLNRKKSGAFFNANPRLYYTYFQDSVPYRLDPIWYESKLIASEDSFFAVTGTINHNILYLYFSSFNITGNINSNSDSALNSVITFYRDRFSFDSTQYNGAIIDVRGNPGGSIEDIDTLLGGIVNSPWQIGYTRSKSGNGRLDYTPWEPVYISPSSSGKPLASTQKIVVLADDWSESAAEQLTMAIKTIPNTTFIGDTTWGANGPFLGGSTYTDFFGGSFNIGTIGEGTGEPAGTFGFVKTSYAMFKYLNGTFYEGKGFPPDMVVNRSGARTYSRGQDSALEKAIRLFP